MAPNAENDPEEEATESAEASPSSKAERPRTRRTKTRQAARERSPEPDRSGILAALETAPASYVVAMRQGSVFFTLLLGIVLLRERPPRQRWIGALATIAGVALIARFGS